LLKVKQTREIVPGYDEEHVEQRQCDSSRDNERTKRRTIYNSGTKYNQDIESGGWFGI
jgi:hypothetical protein